MRVEEVYFNHDTSSASSDALNIRTNAGGAPITAPEWRRGLTPQPAAYAAAALGPSVTIKARFSGGPPGATVTVRAVDAYVPPSPGGCLGWLITWLAALVRALFGNALGDTDERAVTFDAAGRSGLVTFELVHHKLKTSGVGIRTTDWRWRYHDDAGWHDFDTTQHKVYLLLDLPAAPWSQDLAGAPTQLPWTDALDKACLWALGTTTTDAAAERVTVAVNTQPNQSYTPATTFVDFGTDGYKLGSYLAQLNGGAPFQLNCTDCADAVTTFANLLGCDLWEGRFTNLVTKKFLTLNGDPSVEADWVSWTWGYHEICWLHAMGQNERIYDGCLQVDMDDDPADLVHVARHPVKMRFGMNAADDYRFRLVASGTATLAAAPVRRAVQ